MGAPPDDQGEDVPRILDSSLRSVVYLYRSFHEADEGVNIGGSGFLVSIPCQNFPPPNHHVYAVTNKHVIAGGAIHVRLNTKSGGKLVMQAKNSNWFCATNDDLAVIALGNLPDAASVITIPAECFVTREFVKEHDIGIGDEVVMLGRFISREGVQQNSPTARFGHISQMPGDPMTIVIDGKEHIQDEAFLCEVRSIGGYSGSPVMVLPNNMYSRNGKQLSSKKGILLGVDFCHVPNWTEASDDKGRPLPHIRVPLNSGMAGVIPAWKLQELIMSDGPVKQRARAEESEAARRRSPMLSQIP